MSTADPTSLPLDERLRTHRAGTVVAVLILSVIVGYFSRSETTDTIRIWLMHAQVPCEHITSGTACGEKTHWTYACDGRIFTGNDDDSRDQLIAHIRGVGDSWEKDLDSQERRHPRVILMPVEVIVLPTTSAGQAIRLIYLIAHAGFPRVRYRLSAGDFPFGGKTIAWHLRTVNEMPNGINGQPTSLFDLKVTSSVYTAGPLDTIDNQPLRADSSLQAMANAAISARRIAPEVIAWQRSRNRAIPPTILASSTASWIRVLARYHELVKLGFSPPDIGSWELR